MADKILLTNLAALKKKYKPAGVQAVLAAARALIAADKARGLSTRLVDLSDADAMKSFKGTAVKNPQSGRQNKDAVDKIFEAVRPDYMVILDGPDVVPHLSLINTQPADKDPDVPSDLPYASDAPFVRRDVAAYCAVTRVVGRIPGITGAADPAFLLAQLAASAAFETRKRDDYLKPFALSTELWEDSTRMSVGAIFGDEATLLCPPTGDPGINRHLGAMMHFINCHGAQAFPRFLGQGLDGQMSIAMTGDGVATKAPAGAVVAAECCYGAELYDPDLAGGAKPISIRYLENKAAGYFGSTTIAYGPVSGNSGADLLTQYFLIDVLAGASLGRACLQARQKFVQGQRMEDPVNLKTIGQFILLGDPSLQPCARDQAVAGVLAQGVDEGRARERRRIELAAAGKAMADSSAFLGKRLRAPGPAVSKLFLTIARKRGFSPARIEAFDVTGGAGYRAAMKAHQVQSKVLVMAQPLERKRRAHAGKRKTISTKRAAKAATAAAAAAGGGMPSALPSLRVLVAHTQDGRVIGVSEYVSR